MGGMFKAKAFCAQRKAPAQIHLLMLLLLSPPSLPHTYTAKAQATQPSQCALNPASFSCAFPHGALTAYPSLLPMCGKILSVPERVNSNAIPLQILL